MTLRFGTDGVRGVANEELTPELVLALGRAAARVLGRDRFVIGRDTRRSGPLLESALAAGLAAEGATVELVGVLPTPAIARICATEGIPGAVISASHNAFADNGVKFFTAGGRKLTDETEAALEAGLGTPTGDARTGAGVGDVVHRTEAAPAYVDHLVASLEGRNLDGLRVVLDCGNGAANAVGPEVLRRLGADLTVIGVEPDGININLGCGSTDTAALARTAVDIGADVGLALDGDADRVLAVAGDGRPVDGDHLIALCALDLLQRGRLRDDTVVVTVMTNLGFRLAMAERGIKVVETAVGDRNVLEALEAGGWSLGGEQSGHVILPDLATTGDGLLTGLQLLDLVRRDGRPLATMAAEAMTQLPQVLRNVRVQIRGADVAAAIAADTAAVEAGLGDTGRVLIRPSGTEPLVRVMVEAATTEAATAAADRLVAAVEQASRQ